MAITAALGGPPVTLTNTAGGEITTANPLPVAAAPGGRLSSGYVGTATWTPAAAAYTANDVMATAQQLVGFGPAAGGEVRVETVEFEVDTTAVISGETSYRMYLYSVTPPSALADNAAFDIPSGDRASFLGYIDCGTPVDLGSTLYVKTTGDGTHITCPVGGAPYAYLVTNGGFTATAVARKVKMHTVAI